MKKVNLTKPDNTSLLEFIKKLEFRYNCSGECLAYLDGDLIGKQLKDGRWIEFLNREKQVELDCPFNFTSRCTMGRCDCKPKKE